MKIYPYCSVDGRFFGGPSVRFIDSHLERSIASTFSASSDSSRERQHALSSDTESVLHLIRLYPGAHLL
jgi:hypothetical protein